MDESAVNIPYGKHEITQEDIEAVNAVLRSEYLTQGPKVPEFEKEFAEYIGCRFAAALSSGTAALHLSALALGVSPGDRVITTPITFAASANCVLYCSGQVDFVDIDPETALMDLELLEQKLSSSPSGHYKGLIPVDFTGCPVDMERLNGIARRHNLWILEDACHAPGGSFTDKGGRQQKCGNGVFTDLAVFSFHPVKHIACGEGGMITTNRKDLHDKIKLFRTHGITKDKADFVNSGPSDGAWYYEMQDLGYNYRLSDISAALGISQLTRIEEGIRRRRLIAERYTQAFQNTKIIPLAHHSRHVYHLYVIRIPDRRRVYETLRKRGIFTQVHYIPVHLQPYYRRLGFRKGDFPEAEKFYDEALSLPMFPSLSQELQEFVIREVINALG